MPTRYNPSPLTRARCAKPTDRNKVGGAPFATPGRWSLTVGMTVGPSAVGGRPAGRTPPLRPVGPPANLGGMSTLAEIESAITQLPVTDAQALREWLEQWLEDWREMTPEFLAAIERGKTNSAEGRRRVVRP